jgi:large subunit ribosomal protein L6
MSRIGKQPIVLPKGVEVKVVDRVVHAKGPKGNNEFPLMAGIDLVVHPDHIDVVADENDKEISKFHGLYRSLVNNMVTGVNKGFERRLEMIGVGYRAAVKGRNLDLQIGISHPMELPIPEGINVVVETNTNIIVTGSDKQKVGQFAASIRSKKPPEPYQGKGIRYKGEYVRKKAGKAAAKK